MPQRNQSYVRPNLSSLSSVFRIKPLCVAIIGQLFAAGALAAPTGGTVVGGEGVINQSGLDTTITQGTDRLAIEWDSFNVAANERVNFVQPSESSIALNRILDLNGSQILGRIDANGRIILLNPNGILFGAGSQVNVGSLVATGLNLNTDDFLNGDLILQAVEDSAGTIINRGLINASTGGNVALIGKQVTNTGLINADLGHVVLASGNAAVVTFDDQGLIGVRVDEAAIDVDTGVTNSGLIEAAGGKILLTASVSEDLFSRAVNSGDLGGDTQVVLHDDGSFSLGSGVDVLNTGSLSVNAIAGTAGEVVLAGRNVTQRGAVTANNESGAAGGIHLLATDTLRLNGGGSLSAQGDTGSGHIVLEGDQVIGATGNPILTSGDVEVTVYIYANLPHISAQNLTINSIGTVRQVGSLLISDNTHFYVTAGADVRLNNTANDFGSVTMNTGHTSFISLTETGGIDLGELDVLDSIVHIQSDGAIRQLDGTSITLDASDLHLTGDSIALGTRAEGSGVYMIYSWLDLNFSNSIDVVNAISSPSEFDVSLVTAKGYDGVNRVNARSQAQFEQPTIYGPSQFALSATLNDSGIQIGRLNANSASLSSIGNISQTGAIETSSFSLTATAGSDVALTHEDNDFRTVNLTLGHTTTVDIADKNDILLGNLNILDSWVKFTSLGENGMVSQLAGTAIDLSDSTLEVHAARIYLGDRSGATLNLHGFSDLHAAYSRDARIVGTSTGLEEFPEFIPFQVEGLSDTTSFSVTGHGDFSLYTTSNYEQFVIRELNATDAEILTFLDIVQLGKITLTGDFFLRTPVGSQVTLENPENDFNSITIEAGHATAISLTDANDIALGNWDLLDASITLRSLGEDSTVKQLENTHIVGGDSSLSISAAHIDLGSAGTSSVDLGNIGMLQAIFSKSLLLNGAIRLGGFSSYLNLEGTDGANKLTIGEFADIDITSDFEEFLIDLKGGDDIVEIYRDFNYGFFTGLGEDGIYLANSEISYTVEDFDPDFDDVLILP